MKNIQIIIAAYNEEDNIYETVDTLKKLEIDNILVIDDGSLDNTANYARDAGARVISLDKNCGKGTALEKGKKISSAGIVGILDADLGKSVSEVRALIEGIITNDVDMIIGGIKKRSRGGLGFVLFTARWGIFLITGHKMKYPLSGQRFIRGNIFRDLPEFERGFGIEVGMNIDIIEQGYKILEIDTNMCHREMGRDIAGFVHRGRQFIHIISVLIRRFIYHVLYVRMRSFSKSVWKFMCISCL